MWLYSLWYPGSESREYCGCDKQGRTNLRLRRRPKTLDQDGIRVYMEYFLNPVYWFLISIHTVYKVEWQVFMYLYFYINKLPFLNGKDHFQLLRYVIRCKVYNASLAQHLMKTSYVNVLGDPQAFQCWCSLKHFKNSDFWSTLLSWHAGSVSDWWCRIMCRFI